MMIILLVIDKVFCCEWVIMMKVMFSFCWIFLSSIIMVCFRLKFSELRGLFSSKIVGWLISVCVRVICCCWLLLRLWGKWVVSVDILIIFSVFYIDCCCLLEDWLCIFKLNLMFWNIDWCGKSVKFWNIIVVLCFEGGRFVIFLLVK